MSSVIIIGAGIIGLQTANTFLDAGYKVSIIAKHWPGDESIEYTSPWAGAIWRTHATKHDIEQVKWNIQSYEYWMEIVETRPEEAEKMGLQRVPITVFSNEPDTDLESPYLWYSTHVRDFSIIPPSSIHPSGPKSAHTFTSFAINPVKYLSYLLTRAKSLGAQTITATLPTSDGLSNALSTISQHFDTTTTSTPIVINCTGLGAKQVAGDETMYPIRGQTLLVRITPPPTQPRILLYDTKPLAHILPRTGTPLYLIGGTNDVSSTSPFPTPSITSGILQRCRNLMKGWIADDASIEVVSEQVGLRPGRNGGARVEVEEVHVLGRRVVVVHQYGHAGAGYQNSLGSARRALEIVEEFLEEGIE